MNNKQIAQALRAIDLDALPIKDRAAVLNAAEALELGEAHSVTDEDIDSFLAEPFELNYSNYNSDDIEQLQNWAMRAYDIIKARAALSAAAGDAKRNAERLDFMIDRQCWVQADTLGRYYVMSQDEDENHCILSGPSHLTFKTQREAIDAAIAAASKGE